MRLDVVAVITVGWDAITVTSDNKRFLHSAAAVLR